MGDDSPINPKKDLSGIFQLPPDPSDGKATSADGEENLNFEKKIEKIDSFESLDQLGPLDHPVETHTASPEDDFPVSLPSEGEISESFSQDENKASASEAVFSSDEPIAEEDDFASLTSDAKAAAHDADPFAPDFGLSHSTSSVSEPDTTDSEKMLDGLRHYSEKAQENALREKAVAREAEIFHPFHLHIQGNFDVYAQDKLMLFITEHQIGISSSDLSLQIKSSRVLFPRISEYAGIKLIQLLRDSGLTFSLKESEQYTEVANDEGIQYHYSGEGRRKTDVEALDLPILSGHPTALALYQEIDSVRADQFVKAEMIEFEKSEILQNVIERMTEALKKKAALKGAHALGKLKQTITPLRLPSQYQISLEASVLKKL
jgi:hypothetical protein